MRRRSLLIDGCNELCADVGANNAAIDLQVPTMLRVPKDNAASITKCNTLAAADGWAVIDGDLGGTVFVSSLTVPEPKKIVLTPSTNMCELRCQIASLFNVPCENQQLVLQGSNTPLLDISPLHRVNSVIRDGDALILVPMDVPQTSWQNWDIKQIQKAVVIEKKRIHVSCKKGHESIGGLTKFLIFVVSCIGYLIGWALYAARMTACQRHLRDSGVSTCIQGSKYIGGIASAVLIGGICGMNLYKLSTRVRNSVDEDRDRFKEIVFGGNV